MKNYLSAFLDFARPAAGLCYSISALAMATSFSVAEEITLAREGKALYVISVPEDAIPAERTAAAQLQKYLHQVTGADFTILAENDVSADLPQILVGTGARAKQSLPPETWRDLGNDGIIIESAPGKLILSGARPRGTLYAVFQFLEDAVGCRWWTPTESSIPHKQTLTVAEQNVRYTPKFSYREHFATSPRYHPEFATILRENGHHQAQSEAWGGHYELLGFSHTFSELLPPEKYFKEHPEWYTDPANGSLPATRNSPRPEAQKTQLCLSNPEALKELTKNALHWIEKNPNAGYISISQNDYAAYCQCADCQEVSRREGSESAPLLKFVNAVAEEIGRRYPDFWVETMAYTYSEKPPRTIRPAENVVIRLALALADFGHPISSEWNKEARDKVLGWADIAPHLFIWSYATNFKKTMFPHPNWSSLAEDLRFFASHHVQGMFVQGDCYTGNVGDFPHLRAWLMGKLLWNPDLDQKALTSEFLQGYYGAAGPYLQQYIDLITSSFTAQNRGLNTNNRDFSFLTLDTITRAAELFSKAREAVAGNRDLLDRVRREELSLIAGRLARDRALRAEAQQAGIAYPSLAEVEEQRAAFIQSTKEFGLKLWGENISPEEGLDEIRRTESPIVVELPTFARKVPRSDIIDFQPAMMTLALEGSLTSIQPDADASGGSAAAMMTNSHIWLVQAQLGPYLDVVNEEWRVFAMARYTKKTKSPPRGTAFEGGIFDDSGMKHIARFVVDFGQLSDSEYQVVDLGVHRLDPGMVLWFAPHSAEYADKILFDRILLIRASSANSLVRGKSE